MDDTEKLYLLADRLLWSALAELVFAIVLVLLPSVASALIIMIVGIAAAGTAKFLFLRHAQLVENEKGGKR